MIAPLSKTGLPVLALLAGLGAGLGAGLPVAAQQAPGADLTAPRRLVLPLFLPAPARETARRVLAPGRQMLATGPWSPAGIPSLALEGRIEQTAWQLDSGTAGTLDLLAALRSQLVAEGYEVLFQCGTEECGGFDFRYEIDLLPEPEMHVDLGDFRYLSARKGTGAEALYLGVVLSRSREAGYLQITTVAPAGLAAAAAAPGAPVATPPPADTSTDPGAGTAMGASTPFAGGAQGGGLGAALELAGHVALDDLVFASGSADLSPGDFASLTALAAYLAQNPDRGVILVGHTDTQGSQESNAALSRRRSESVMARLVEMGVPAGQLAAEGVGFLSPRASNLSEEGRRQNRRVEAVLAPTP